MGRFSEGLRAGSGMVKGAIDARRESEDRAREDQQRALMEQANARGFEAYKEAQSSWEKSNQPQTSERLTLGATSAGNDAGLQAPDLGGSSLGLGPSASVQPDSAGLGGRMGLSLGAVNKPMERETVTTPAAKWDEDNGREAYHSARSKFLMENKADPEVWMKDWTLGASIRAQRRQGDLNKAYSKFGATGNAGDYIKTILPMFDAGLEVVDAKPNLKLAGGGDGWQFTFKDKYSGEDFTKEFTTDQIRQYGLSLQDPKFGMTFEGERLMAMMKANAKIQETEGEEKAKRPNLLLGGEIKKDVATHEHGLNLDAIAARGKQTRLSDAARASDPRTTLAAIDSERRSLRDQLTALQRDYTNELKGVDEMDSDGKASLRSAYERQVQEVNAQIADLEGRRQQVNPSMGLASGGQSAGGGAPKPSKPAQISSKAQFDALPSGATFVAPDGTTRRKP